MPKLSIGLPVFNGENYISEALSSLLSQSFRDFELIICDNASTDGTEKVYKAYAVRDKRIKFKRNSQNLGAAENYNLTFKLSKGQYFKWAAHDDMCDPTYLEKCINKLENDQQSILCQTGIKIIDENGNFIKEHKHYRHKHRHHNSSEPYLRFAEQILSWHPCYDVFGVMRSEILSKTKLIENYVGSDRPLLAELSLHGAFRHIPEKLFYPREHPERSIRRYQEQPDTYAEWFDPMKRNTIALRFWRYFWEYYKSASRVKLNMRNRLKCYENICRYARWNQKYLVDDLYQAKRLLFHKRTKRKRAL